MRVLVTGVLGFTGRHLARRLASEGHEVVGLSAHPVASGLPPPDLRQLFVCDLNDNVALSSTVRQAQPTHVAHLAGVSFVAHGRRADFYQTNVVGTLNLLGALAELPVPPKKVLIPSSANIYGQCDAESIDEDQLPAPASDYAVSKLAMEYAARLWCDRLPIIIVRPFNYTGAGQGEHFLVPKIVAHYRDSRPTLELGNLDVARDFSDVRWVTDIYTRLLQSKLHGQTYNVCSGTAWSLTDILETCATITGHRPEIRINPAFVRGNELKRLCGDPARLQAALPQLPAPIPLARTLAWMLTGRE